MPQSGVQLDVLHLEAGITSVTQQIVWNRTVCTRHWEKQRNVWSAVPHVQAETLGMRQVLQPVKAAAGTQAALGATSVLTPVRRSTRMTSGSQLTPLVGLADQLQETDWAYTPNRALPDQDQCVVSSLSYAMDSLKLAQSHVGKKA